MHRYRYIRFFVSSTFADMEIERNVLHEVMHELQMDYQSKNWQIEYVDLRWGITDNAGLDNNTIPICRAELARCQQLSPKPNFIVLYGQRRGWIPLPNLIPEREMSRLKSQASAVQTKLLSDWYLLDQNYVMASNYALQPRYGRFVDESIWNTEVYEPLVSLIGSGLMSATEIEIQDGALNVTDAQEHVLLYHRTFTQIPQSEYHTYVNGECLESRQTFVKLRNKIGHDNYYAETLSYSDYQSKAFAMRFKAEMKRHLCLIIDKTIKEYAFEDDENTLHTEVAKSMSDFFVGRKVELTEIDNYIRTSNPGHALWLRAESGTGKSAVISQIYKRYQSSHNIICRYCGTTSESANGAVLMNSIWTELRRLYPLTNWAIKDLPGFGQKAHSILSMSATEMFQTRLRSVVGKPLLILIDGLDQLVDADSAECFALDWLDGGTSPSVRVIFTSTKDCRINAYHLNRIRQIQLESMQKPEAMDVVKGLLQREKRTLTPEQWKAVENCVIGSDRMPVFLTLLGQFLTRFASYEKLPKIPTDINGLMRLVLDTLSSSHHHDPEVVRSALSLLCCERLGLSHTEMNRALSLDQALMEHLQEVSHHAITGKDIPPILWSRLYQDLSFFFREQHGKYGHLIKIYHQTIVNAIKEIYLTDDYAKAYPYIVLENLYEKADSPHAIHEINYCDYMWRAYMHLKDLNNPRLKDAHFLHSKLILDKADLIHDLGLLALLQQDYLGYENVMNLRKDIADITTCTYKQFMLMCANANSQSPLRKLTGDIPDVLHNVWADIPDYRLKAYTSCHGGKYPLLSNDGKYLLYVTHYGHRVTIENMANVSDAYSYEYPYPIKHINASHDLSCHAFVTEAGAIVYDYKAGVMKSYDTQIQNATWITISADGETWAYGNSAQCYISPFGLQSWGAKTAKMSASGRFLWYAYKEGIMRLDTKSGKGDVIDLKSCDSGSLTILAASDNETVVECNDYVFIIKIDHYGIRQSCMPKLTSYKAAINDGRIVLFDTYPGDCQVYEFTDKGLMLKYNTVLHGVTTISPNLEFAYDSSEQICYRLPLLLDSFKYYNSYNVGLNTISCSRDGNLIAITCGKNEFQEKFGDIYLMHDGREKKISLTGKIKSAFPSSCEVSPDGDSIWISGCVPDDDLICVSTKGNIVARIPNAGGKLAMRFTPDGKLLVAVAGHHIADSAPLFHIVDAKMHTLVTTFEPKGLAEVVCVKSSYDMCISRSGKYAIFESGSVFYAIDLNSHKLLGSKETRHIVEHDMVKPRFTVSKSGDIEYHCNGNHRQTKRAYVQDICLWRETLGGLAVVSKQGKVSFFKHGNY